MSREAMQQALEALEKVITAFGSGLTLQQNAITALRQALVDADDTSQERVDEKAKREQEPVAWISERDNLLSWDKFYDHMKPLYTAPPKKQWVGLTDDAVFELADTNLYDGGKNYGVLAFAKAIEQTLKEKNHGREQECKDTSR